MLNAKEARERLGGICHNSVVSLVERKILTAPRKLGGRLYWLESEVEDAIKQLMLKSAA